MSKLEVNDTGLKQTFYKEVARILWDKWDPIGLNDGDDWSEGWPDDEYDGYAG